MSDRQLPTPFRGIIPPLLTPLAERDQLDLPGLEQLVEHVLAGGVHGLFILGTTGEGPGLSYGLRHELVEKVCKQVAGRVPVLVGITDTSLVESLRLAEHAEDAGASAVVASAPYYFPMGQAELRRTVKVLATETPLPLFLYNMPSHTKMFFDLETVRQAMDLPNVAGLKDSGGDLKYFHEVGCLIRQRRPDWSLLIGPEELVGEAVLLGAHGGVSGGANLAPRLYVDLYEAAVRQDVARVRALSERVWSISRNIYKYGVFRGLKCALSLLGVCSDVLAEPFERVSEQEKQAIAKALGELGLCAEPESAKNGAPSHQVVA